MISIDDLGMDKPLHTRSRDVRALYYETRRENVFVSSNSVSLAIRMASLDIGGFNFQEFYDR